ncbi:MAG: VWA domain-containing protein [Acidobacteria bacterium]|nr:VWA domain-containing protein [Acidobacteriota bacterium]MDA1236096.1 VWA domain-containing protein [Acidobacteriota bacterium]
MTRQNDKRSGQILILFTLFIGFLMGFAAIAFALAYAMVVRTQLVTALDSATLAAIRAVPQGNAVMQQASQRAFDANLPSGRLLTLNPTLSAPNVTTSAGVVSVQFTASVDAPMFFARWFGRDRMIVSAQSTSARRDRNVILVLDYSGSVQPVLPDIREAAKVFVDSFSDTSDQVGLVIFSTAGRIEYAPQKPFKSDLQTAIDNIQPEFLTNHAAGLYWAYRALLELNDPLKSSKMNEIVFFTDGRANWFPGNFNVKVGGGSNQCASSPVSGVYGITSGNPHYRNRVLSLQAAASPGAPPITPLCPNWVRGQNALQSIQPLWTPPASPTAGSIFPTGVSLSGFRDSAPNFNQTDPSNAWRENIAANSVDNLARLIRQDTNLNIRIHTIGYQGTDPLQYDVLERLANCDGCTRVDPNDAIDATQAKGRFVAALNQDDLLSAFLDVAGFIGRIVQ